MDLEVIKRRKEGYRDHWVYIEHSRPVMIVARYDTDKGKVYHQFSFLEGEWKEGMPQPPYPLFGLDSLFHHSPIRAVAICEGEKCAAALHQLNWPAVTTVLGASSFHHSDFTPLRHFKQFVILHDNDEPGYAFARGIATEILRIRDDAMITVCNLMPNLPHGDLIDWLQERPLYGNNWDGFAQIPREMLVAAKSGLNKAINEKTIAITECPKVKFQADVALFRGEPTPLVPKLIDVPPFPLHLLPEKVGEYLSICAKQFSSPVDFSATALLTLIGGLIGRSIQLEMRPGHQWLESANIWAILVGRPSAKKSPILRRINKFIHHLEKTAGAEFRQAVALYKQEEKRCKAGKVDFEQEAPLLRRYTTHDCTTSKLRELFSQNPKGITLYCDELKGQLQKLDKTVNEDDRSFYMSCWSGLENYNEDRILRGSNVDIPLTLSWIGCIPPASLAVYLRQAMSDGYDADGLLQRFQLITFPDFNQEYQICNEPVSEKILSEIQDLFCKIDTYTRMSSALLRFSSEAQKVFDDWHSKNENDCRSGDYPLYWESHIGKYPKLFGSLCIILYTMKMVLTEGDEKEVGLDTIQETLGLIEYYKAHANRCYESIETDELYVARTILKLIEQKKLDYRFKNADIYRYGLAGLKDSERVKKGLYLLAEEGYIVEEKISSINGAPTRLWVVHPSLRR